MYHIWFHMSKIFYEIYMKLICVKQMSLKYDQLFETMKSQLVCGCIEIPKNVKKLQIGRHVQVLMPLNISKRHILSKHTHQEWNFNQRSVTNIKWIFSEQVP